MKEDAEFFRVSMKMPKELKEKLNTEAEKQRRSVHNLMLMILWNYFDKKDSDSKPSG